MNYARKRDKKHTTPQNEIQIAQKFINRIDGEKCAISLCVETEGFANNASERDASPWLMWWIISKSSKTAAIRMHSKTWRRYAIVATHARQPQSGRGGYEISQANPRDRSCAQLFTNSKTKGWG